MGPGRSFVGASELRKGGKDGRTSRGLEAPMTVGSQTLAASHLAQTPAMAMAVGPCS